MKLFGRAYKAEIGMAVFDCKFAILIPCVCARMMADSSERPDLNSI